jgi:CubicO group peptidase (beta-lactamase class C family)
MVYRWLLVHLVWTSMALLPVLAQAGESTSAPGPNTSPASRGVDGAPLDAVLPAFEDYAEHARITWGTPGMAIAVVHRDQVVYTKGFGVKKMGGADPIDPHTFFRSALPRRPSPPPLWHGWRMGRNSIGRIR